MVQLTKVMGTIQFTHCLFKFHNHSCIIGIQSIIKHRFDEGGGHLMVKGHLYSQVLLRVILYGWLYLDINNAISLSPCYHTLLTPSLFSCPFCLPFTTFLSRASSISLPGACPLDLTSRSVARTAVK